MLTASGDLWTLDCGDFATKMVQLPEELVVPVDIGATRRRVYRLVAVDKEKRIAKFVFDREERR